MDMSKFDSVKASEEGMVLHLLDPKYGEPLIDEKGPVTITLAGKDGSRYQKHLYAKQDRRIKDMQRGKKYAVPNSEALAEEELERSALCTLSWTNIDEDGKPLECNYENALFLYRQRKWIADQVEAFIADRSNFFPKLATDSSSTTDDQ